MRRGFPVRFWFEVIAGSIGVTMFVLTLITREWIEVLTSLDPDRGSGVIEVALSLTFIAIAAAAAIAARGNYRRVALARHQLSHNDEVDLGQLSDSKNVREMCAVATREA